MFLSKTKKIFINFHLIPVFFILLIYSLIIPASVFAAVTPAGVACIRDKNHNGQYTGSEADACVAGYNGGNAKKSSNDVCGKYNGDDHDACLDGFGKGACAIDNPSQDTLNKCLNANPIIKSIRLIVNFLSAGVGIVVVGSIIWGGIQYSMAGNNPQAVSAAKKRIQDTLIALLAFFFIYAFLQWIIPGGLLEGII
jgi:hypothetical protein